MDSAWLRPGKGARPRWSWSSDVQSPAITTTEEPATWALKSCPASWYEPPITCAMTTPTLPLIRWYPSAIAATSPSCLPTTSRWSPSSASAAKIPVSADPGFVKRYSTPASFRVWRSSIPPVPVMVLRMVSPCRTSLSRSTIPGASARVGEHSTRAGASSARNPSPSGSRTRAQEVLVLELHVLVGGEGAHPDVRDRVPGDAGADAHQDAEVHDRREHRPVDRELLNLVQERFALLGVALARLLQEQIVDVGIAAVGVGALGLDERLHPARGVAGVPHRGEEEPAELLLLPVGVEGRALGRAHLHADAGRGQIVQHRLGHGREPGNPHELPRVEPVRIAGVGELLLRLGEIVRWRLDLQREVHDAGHDHARRRTQAEARRLVDLLAVQREVHREPHPLVVPRRLRIPLVGELDPEDRRVLRGHHLHPRVALETLGVGAVEHVPDVGLS